MMTGFSQLTFQILFAFLSCFSLQKSEQNSCSVFLIKDSLMKIIIKTFSQAR